MAVAPSLDGCVQRDRVRPRIAFICDRKTDGIFRLCSGDGDERNAVRPGTEIRVQRRGRSDLAHPGRRAGMNGQLIDPRVPYIIRGKNGAVTDRRRLRRNKAGKAKQCGNMVPRFHKYPLRVYRIMFERCEAQPGNRLRKRKDIWRLETEIRVDAAVADQYASGTSAKILGLLTASLLIASLRGYVILYLAGFSETPAPRREPGRRRRISVPTRVPHPCQRLRETAHVLFGLKVRPVK